MAFGNRTLAVHVARGVLGFGALWFALGLYPRWGWPTLLLLPVTLWALKGCPICWTIGLVETIAFRMLAAREGETD